jgi:hypothetical protein
MGFFCCKIETLIVIYKINKQKKCQNKDKHTLSSIQYCLFDKTKKSFGLNPYFF